MYQSYHAVAELYLLIKDLVTPTLCVVGWLLLGRAAGKRLHSYVHWFLPSMIGATVGTAGLLLETLATFFTRRDYALAIAVYFFYLASAPFHVVSIARLWKTITNLPSSPSKQPQTSHAAPDESVWPPPPRR